MMTCISCTYMFVCDECIESESHHGHQLLTFDSASKHVMERLRQEQEANEVIQSHLESDVVQCSAVIEQEVNFSDSRKQNIIKRREHLKNHIDLVADKLLREHEEESKSVLDQIDAEKKRIQISIISAGEFHKEVNSLSRCRNATGIIALGRLLSRPNIVREPFPLISRLTLQDRDSTDDDIIHLFGHKAEEDMKMSYPSFFNEDGTFVKTESLSPRPHTPEFLQDDIPEIPGGIKKENAVTEEIKVNPQNKGDNSFCVTSESVVRTANIPRLPLLETEITDDSEPEAEEIHKDSVTDAIGNLPCQNMKNYDTFLRYSGEFSQSDSTFDGSFSSSVSTPAYFSCETSHGLVDEKISDITNEEDVFVSTENGKIGISTNTEISSSLESLTVKYVDNQSDVQERSKEIDKNANQISELNDQDEDVFFSGDTKSEDISFFHDDESDSSSFGKVMERGNSFKANYFESVHFEEFIPHATENGDVSSKNLSNGSADIEVEEVQLRPKSKRRDLFPSKEYPIMERTSKQIDDVRIQEKLEGNKDDSVLPRVMFGDNSPSAYRTPLTPNVIRRSAPSIQKYSTLPVSRKQSFLQQDPSVRLKLKHSFSIDSPVIIACPTSEGRCWLSSFNRENEIVLVNRRGRVKRTVQFDTLVLGMTHLAPNQLLVCCRDEMCIKQVLQNFQIKTFFSTAPLRPSYICCGFTDEMFVTLTNKSSWSIENGSISVAVKYSGATCQEMARAQYDPDGDDIFFFPSRICLDSRCLLVAIINYTSPSTSHLVLLDRHMSLVMRHIDHNKVISAKERMPSNLPEQFFITDVRFDPYDNIIIAEHYTKEIRLLDQSCQLLRVLVCELATPWSLALQPNGYLWVGFDDGSINVYSSKLKSKRVVSLQRTIPSPW